MIVLTLLFEFDIRTVLRRKSKIWLIKRNPNFRRACFYNSLFIQNQIQRSNTDTKGISILARALSEHSHMLISLMDKKAAKWRKNLL